MKEYFRFSSFALIAGSLMFASCSDNKEEPIPTPEPGKETVKVDPKTVFTQGIPSQVGDLVITTNADGLVSEIVDGDVVTTFDYTGASKTKSRDAVNIPSDYDMTFVVKSEDPDDNNEAFTYYVKLTDQGFIEYAYEVNTEDGKAPAVDEWWFKYNELGQMIEMKRSEGDNEVTTITYNSDGDITTVKVKDDIDGEKETTTILYTDASHTSPVSNKSGIMLYDYSLHIDMDEMAPAYFAGLLGKGTAHLPLSAKSVYATADHSSTSTYTFSWELNASDMPTKFTSVQHYEWGDETDVIDLKW